MTCSAMPALHRTRWLRNAPTRSEADKLRETPLHRRSLLLRRSMSATPEPVQLVLQALAGERAAVERVVSEVTPVIRVRAMRALMRGAGGGRDARQEVDDVSQEVLLRLFADDGRILRGWKPSRGLSLRNFVGLVTERHVIGLLRSRRRSPWTESPAEAEAIERSAAPTATHEERVASRQLFRQLWDRLREEVSPRGLQVFELLFVEGRTVEEVCERTGLTANGVYVWRSRLRKAARALAVELGGAPASPVQVGGPR